MRKVVGKKILKAHPVSKLPETMESVVWNPRGVEGWGEVHFPLDIDGCRVMNCKKDVEIYINSFVEKYKEQPVFEINREKEWFSAIWVSNDKFQAERERFIESKSNALQGWRS